ncbi:hypothetical protein [Roseofilum casamattae]|uniref:Thioredoxin domain-containing protein n=1 Tax=Roseofilum casamattae BLCC-M143 TaxID=3022442 RepID=A0ABT7C085_9CYAN|nr:hypothetical protein [Roseofilum casamattae]MDJ1184462.1 hypothetical protein [Roseofilum casamattae BLCC-M143]
MNWRQYSSNALMSLRPSTLLLWLAISLGGLVLVTGNIISGDRTLSAQAQSLELFVPIKTPSTPASLALARHLQQIGAKMYGASWCPHCHAQKERFGKEATAEILGSTAQSIYVECSPQGRSAPQATVCQDAGIGVYPTWLIGGEKYEGNLSLQKLAELSEYSGSQEF